MPPNGGTVHAQNTPMEPFFSEVKLNTSMSARILGVTLRFDSFPHSHAHFDSGHPGLGEDTFDGVLVPEVPFASFGPYVVLRCSWCHWKGLEAYISKMASHRPFGHLSPKLWAKEGSGVKLAV